MPAVDAGIASQPAPRQLWMLTRSVFPTLAQDKLTPIDNLENRMTHPQVSLSSAA
jgi:hypothetical protein